MVESCCGGERPDGLGGRAPASAGPQPPTTWASAPRSWAIFVRPVTDLLTVLTGPRRIGKSVALLDAAASLCARSDVDPRQVIHLPCDGMRERDLRRSLTLGRELTRSVDTDNPRPRGRLLDEVTAVGGWSAVLKAARDGTAFGDDTVVATGSPWAGAGPH